MNFIWEYFLDAARTQFEGNMLSKRYQKKTSNQWTTHIYSINIRAIVAINVVYYKII